MIHTIYTLIRGKTSSSWDTATELLALALQSPVAGALRGSGAGVERLGTYMRMVKLRAIRDEGVQREGIGERLVLVTDEGDDEMGAEGKGWGIEMSDGLKQNLITNTAAAASSVSPLLSEISSQEEVGEERSNMKRRKVIVDRKYL